MVRRSILSVGVWLLHLCALCPLHAEPPVNLDFSFSNYPEGWNADFSDYPVGQESFYELDWGWESLPSGTSSAYTKGLYVSGNNHSDDLFMFFKHPISGLVPNTLYSINFEATLASNIPEGMFGIGGSPGESVFVKIGASSQEPQKIAIRNYYFLNVDKGNQSQGGANARVVGHLANPHVDPLNPQYLAQTYESTHPLQVQTDGQGHLWIFIGTDSGFEGTTKFYLLNLKLGFNALYKSD